MAAKKPPDAYTSMQRKVQNEPSCMIPLLLQNNNAAADFSSQEVFAGIVANSFKKSRGSASEMRPNKSEKMARMSIFGHGSNGGSMNWSAVLGHICVSDTAHK